MEMCEPRMAESSGEPREKPKGASQASVKKEAKSVIRMDFSRSESMPAWRSGSRAASIVSSEIIGWVPTRKRCAPGAGV